MGKGGRPLLQNCLLYTSKRLPDASRKLNASLSAIEEEYQRLMTLSRAVSYTHLLRERLVNAVLIRPLLSPVTVVTVVRRCQRLPGNPA